MDICRFCHIVHRELLDNIHDYDGNDFKKYWTITEYDAVLDALERNVIEDGDEDTLLTEENVFLDVETDDIPEETMEDNSENEEDDSDDDAGLANRDYGLRRRCPLNQLQAFHAVLSFPPDCMHDWLEGVIVS